MKLKSWLFALIFSAPFFVNAQTVNQEWFKEFADKNEREDLRVQTDSEGYIYFYAHNFVYKIFLMSNQ